MSQVQLLENIPDVIIDTTGGEKFIVAEVKINDAKKVVIRAKSKCRYHCDIENKLREEVRPLGAIAWCIGGGKYRIDYIKNTITIWGESGEFSKEPDRGRTVVMMQQAFPEFLVITLDTNSAVEAGLEL